MRKIKMMTSAVLLSLSLAFSLTACGTKSEPAADTTAAEAEVTETEGEAEKSAFHGLQTRSIPMHRLTLMLLPKRAASQFIFRRSKPKKMLKMLWQKSMPWL